MEEDIINEVVDQHYADAPLIDTNPETTETYDEEEEYDKRNEIERLLWRDHQHWGSDYGVDSTHES